MPPERVYYTCEVSRVEKGAIWALRYKTGMVESFMKRIIALALLLSLCLLCAGCTGTAGTELAAGIGDEQLGKPYAQM